MDKKELLKKIEDKMEERKYFLMATSNDNMILHYHTPIGEHPSISCELLVFDENNITFQFKYLTKNCTRLITDKIGSFFNDEHFSKFENKFWIYATELYNLEFKGE